MTREDILKLLNKHQDNDTLDIKTAKEMVNIIFDEHEKQLKAKDEENKELSKKCAEIAYDFENSVVEIEKLKTIIEEAIRKPMGVEPHSWSDYKMQKDNT